MLFLFFDWRRDLIPFFLKLSLEMDIKRKEIREKEEEMIEHGKRKENKNF